jgi:CheY-like chemotaxis protein
MGFPEARVWLIVEDDENDFILLKRALQRAEPDSNVQWVRDGAEAKEYLRGEKQYVDRRAFPLPCVVLSDLKMPRCSGLELVQWMRQHPQFRVLPFIMFSASDQPADVGLAYQDGANWYLAKPSAFVEMVEMLRRLSDNLSFSPWPGGT